VYALRVIADDLTGACDVGAELLPWATGIAVRACGVGEDPSIAGVPADALCVRNTQSRTVAPAEAARRVTRALDDVEDGWEGIVLKKIDTGLRGQLGAEIDAAMDRLGLAEAFVLPAIPEVGRTTVGGRQLIDGVPVHETAFARDPQNPIHDSSVPSAIESTGRRRAASIPLAAVRDVAAIGGALDGARSAGASVLVCDAESDADLERAVRAAVMRGRPLLLVGSIGLARALRRVLGVDAGTRPRPMAHGGATDAGALVVVGSAHPTTQLQVTRATERGLFTPVPVTSAEAAEAAGREAGRLVQDGAAAALVPPSSPVEGGSQAVLAMLRTAALTALSRVRPSGLALIGGETAFHVLDGLGHPPLWIEQRLSPLVVRARLVAGPYGGMMLVTKGGSTGAPDLLGAIVRQLGRGGGGQ
jgi:D-threonate/D-erythronate kinase